MSIALILSQEAAIIKAEEQDELHRFVNKELKKIDTPEDLNKWISLAEHVEKSTPESF